MGQGKLRTYQLVGANDWISEFKEQIVRPRFDKLVGNNYQESGKGKEVIFTLGHISIKIGGHSLIRYSKLKDFLKIEKNIAKAISFGVNRPSYVPMALWWAANRSPNPKEIIGEHLKVIGKAITQSKNNPLIKSHIENKLKRGIPFEKTDFSFIEIHKASLSNNPILQAFREAVLAFEAIEKIVWPPAFPINELQIMTEFQSRALHFYQGSDGRKFKRARRFSLVDAIFEQGWV